MIFGQTLRMHTSTYPELIEMSKDAVRARVAFEIERAGRVASAERSEQMVYMRNVREQHHEHGWQIVQRPCSQEDADEIWFTVEQVGVLP